jgi:peptidoglycan/LPS O-acetylase OafA/YrhL
MGNAVWLAAPYLSLLVIWKWRALGCRIPDRTALTLPVGWVAVVGLLAAVAGLWAPPVPVLALLGALSGLAMLTAGRGDDGSDGDDDPRPSPLDWERFDAARRRWGRDPRTGPVRSPSGVA